MLNTSDILETIQMIRQDCLDVRTITMGISLLDVAGGTDSAGCISNRIYDKITQKAEHLVATGEQIEKEYGIPIIHKRVSVTPLSLVGGSLDQDGYVEIAKAMQRAADTTGVNFIGGFSALVHKGIARGDAALMEAIPEALASTHNVCSSVNVGTTRAGINMDAVNICGNIIKQLAVLTEKQDCIGCAKFVVFSNVPEDNPFMAGAFHGVGEPECVINVGVSGPGVVRNAVEKHPDADLSQLADVIKKTAFKVTRMGQLVATEASKRLQVPFGIVDLSLAPTPAVGDSVAHILEGMGVERCGAPGTTAALAMLNDAVKKGGAMASSHVGGLSGAFIPISEDQGMIDAVNCGALSLEKLEAMTCVCSVGLDMIVIPGDIPVTTIAGIIADEAAIGMINNKTTAVRLIPAIGKKVGDMVEFGGLLGYAPVMAVNSFSSKKFVLRGGRIPAPIHSLRN